MILIYKNSKEKITKNFTHAELFTKSPDFTGDSHKFDKKIIDVLQCIRNYYNHPIEVAVTYRTPAHNATIKNAAKNSLHMYFCAIDFKFNNEKIHQEFVYEIQTKGRLYKEIRKMDCNGIGIYDTFIHIDSRNNNLNFNSKDEFGNVQLWNLSTKYQNEVIEEIKPKTRKNKVKELINNNDIDDLHLQE